MIPAIDERYLLVIHIPLYEDAQGRRWLDRLWALDLLQHTRYIEHLTVACPVIRGPAPRDAMCVDGTPIAFVNLRFLHGASSIAFFPWTIWHLWRFIGRADVVHSSVGGWWPISVPNLVAGIARLRGRFLFVIVESSSWRLRAGVRHAWHKRAKAWLSERMNRWLVGTVDMAVFTHERYKEDLMLEDRGRGHVIHASWIDSAFVLSEEEAVRQWRLKRAAPDRVVRLLFAARLTEEKGVRVLLDAWASMRATGMAPRLALEVIGSGDLADLCRQRAEQGGGSIKVLEPVTYGEPFQTLLRQYDAVLVPNLTDEQPRIVYDAFSQGVPVLGFATDGLRECVADGLTGKLCALGSMEALVELLVWAASHSMELETMGLNGLAVARSMTHDEMHRRRHVLLVQGLKK